MNCYLNTFYAVSLLLLVFIKVQDVVQAGKVSNVALLNLRNVKRSRKKKKSEGDLFFCFCSNESRTADVR